jgi:hypothetical protein
MTDAAASQPETKRSWYYNDLFIALSLLFCFPIGLLLMWTGKKWSMGARVIVTLVMIVLVAVATGRKDQQADVPAAATLNQPAQAAEPEPSAPVATVVELATLLSEYKDNEVRADGAFKGKWIQTTGVADDIKKDILDDVYITVGTGQPFEIPQVQCFVAGDQVAKAATFSKGAKVTVRGRVDGLMMNVLVRQCAFVE